MLPQSRPSTVSARSLGVVCLGLFILKNTYDRQCIGSAAYTSGVQLSPFEVDHKTSGESDETVIVSPCEDTKVDRPTTSIPQDTTLEKPNTRTSMIHMGPRPLMLGTHKIVTSSPTTSSKSRPSSSPQARRAPAILPARWSSHTTPLAPLSQRPTSTLLDEVEALKAQLDASEALVKRLMKEKLEVISTSQRICLGLQKERSQLLKEREELMIKLRLLDEVEATQGLLRPTGGVWLAGSSQEQDPAQKLSKPLPPIPTSGSEHDLGITEARQDVEIRLNRPAALEARSQPIVSEMPDARFEYDPESSTDEDILARIGSIFLDSTSQADGCEPGATPKAHHRSHRRTNEIGGSRSIPRIVKRVTPPSKTPLPTRPPPASLDAPEFSCVPDNQLLVPPPIRSVSVPAQARPPQPNMIDLASKIVGSDACPGHSARQRPNSCAKSLVKDGKAAAGSRPPITLTTGVELHAPMARVSTSTGRPRIASSSPRWQASEQPQIQLHHRSTLDGGFATVREHARVNLKPKHRKPSPLRMRNFVPRSSPLANPPINADEVEPEARDVTPCSPPTVDTPENAPGAQPKKRTQLRKLFKQAKSWMSRLV